MAGMKIAVVIGSNEQEKAWNAFRFANLALGKNDEVSVFLVNSCVKNPVYKGKRDVKSLTEKFEQKGGKPLECCACIRRRGIGGVCGISIMETFCKLVMDGNGRFASGARANCGSFSRNKT
jgi:uncharacterized protein involved in oxidation of intracellular sulfur